jgi:NADH-quinone oxidoreductase subunit J
MEYAFFLIFAAVALIAAAMVILSRNPVRAVLFLILCFFATAATWLMLNAEFLAITLVLVYVGAVMVLFLFVVMMLDIDFAILRAKLTRWSPIGLALAIAVFALIAEIIEKDQIAFGQHGDELSKIAETGNAAKLGEIVFTNYLLQFELAGILLLVAIIAAIVLIYRGPRSRKLQSIPKQIAADPKTRVHLVSGD